VQNAGASGGGLLGKIDGINSQQIGQTPFDNELAAFNEEQERRRLAQHAEQVQNESGLEWLGRQMTPAGGAAVGAVGRTLGGVGYIAGALDRAFDDGQSSIQDALYERMAATDEFARRANELSVDAEGNLNTYQNVSSAVASSMPSLGVQLGINALTGGAGGVLGALLNPAAMAYSATSDAAGEAAAVQQELMEKGANANEAARQSDYTFGSNMLLNAATELLGRGLSGVGGRLAGNAGRLLGQGVEEAIQEPAQDVVSEAASYLSADGQPVSPGAYVGNVFNSFAENYPQAIKDTSLTSFLSTMITGGAGEISRIAENSLRRPAPEPIANDPFGIDQAPKNQTPAAQQAVEELSARTDTYASNLNAVADMFSGSATMKTPSAQPLVQSAEMVNEPINQQPTQPVMSRREAALNWAQEELNRLTEGAEYDEEGVITQPMDDASAQRYATIARARANNDLATLEQLQQPAQPDDRELNMIVGERAKGVSKRDPGWFTGADGKRKLETVDQPELVKLAPAGKTTNTTLGEVYKGSKFLEQYPQFKTMPVTFEPDAEEHGSYDPLRGMRVDSGDSAADQLNTVFHELQHAVQIREGFATGASANDPEYDISAGEGEANRVASRINMTAEEKAANPIAQPEGEAVHFFDEDRGYDDGAMPNPINFRSRNGQEYENAVDKQPGGMSFNQRIDDIYDRVAAGTTAPKTAANELFQMAYTGGPTDHSGDFDTAYIGTGQGQKVHGWGLYFSNMQRVSERYRRTYSKPTGVKSIGGQALTPDEERVMGYVNPFLTPSNVGHLRNDRAELDDNQWLRESISTAAKLVGNQMPTRDADILRGILKKAKAGKVKFAGDGQLFEVDIPDNNELLRETATFAKQSPEIQQRLLDYANSAPSTTAKAEQPLFMRDGKPFYKDDLTALSSGTVAEKLIAMSIQNHLSIGDSFTFDDVYDDIDGMAQEAAENGDSADDFDSASSYFEEHFQDYVSDTDLESDSPVIMYVEGQPVYEDMPEQTRGDMEPKTLSTFNVLMTFKNLGGIDIADERLVNYTISERVDALRKAIYALGRDPTSMEGRYETADDVGITLADYEAAQYAIGNREITLNTASGVGQSGFVSSREAREMVRAFTEDKDDSGKTKSPNMMMDGEGLYNNLKYVAKQFGIRETDKAVSELLDSIGIPGLVFTGESVWSGNRKGVDNFVIWNNDRIQTLKKFYQKQMEALAKDNTLDAPADPDLDVDDRIYKDALSKLEKAGLAGVEAQVNARLYSRAFNSFGLLFEQDANALWDSIEFDATQEDLTTEDGVERRGVTRFTDSAEGVPQKMRIAFDFKNADTTTGIHEMFHIFHEMVRKGAMTTDNIVLKMAWQDMKEFAQGDFEKIAYAGTNYVFKGDVKDSAIRRVFDQFRAWLQNLWSTFTHAEKQEFNAPLRRFFDVLLAEDSAFDGLYSADNPRIGNVARNELSKVRERNQEATKRTTKGNVTTVQNVVDRSDVVNPVRQLNSPSVIAKMYQKFAPVFDLGTSAMRQQRAIKTQYAHAIDKVFGKPALLGGRTGGIAKTKQDREDIHTALITGDMFGKELSDAELTQMGITDNAKAGYKRMRSIYKNLGAKLNAQRAKYNKGEFELREGYVPHIFHAFRVHDTDGQIIQSFDKLSDAQKYAANLATDKRQLTIRPAMQDFGGQAKQDAITLGDLQYFKLVNNTANVFAMSQADAKEFASDIGRMANKARYFGNAKHREGYAGYDSDMEYAARHYANISARYIAMDEFKHNARRYFERSFGRFDRQYKGIASYTKDYINDVLGIPTAWEDAENKLIASLPFAKYLPADYQDRPAIALGNKWLGGVAVLKLGLANVGSALVNLSSLNGVAAKTGYKASTKAIGEYTASMLKPKMELQRLYTATGLGDDLTQASANSYSKASDYRRQAMRILGQASSGMYSYMDLAARKIAAIAGYRKALAEGKPINEAYAYAREVVDQTNFNYGVEDTPNIMRRTGQTGAIAMQFKKYPIKAWELGMNHLEGMERVKYWGGMLVLGGLVGGIPLFGAISTAAKALFPEKDLELEIKRVVAGLPLPNSVKRTLLYGALSNIGIDVSSRVGLGDAVSQPAGPTISTIQQIAQGTAKVFSGADGAWWDLVAALAPGLANPGKAFAGQSEDARTGRVKMEYSGGERVARGLGFTPIREAVESDATRINNYEKQQATAEQQAAMRAYMADKSSEARDAMRAAGVTPQQLQRFIKTNKRPGSRFDQAVQDANTRETRDRLINYGGLTE
jgi:hypothetical protein